MHLHLINNMLYNLAIIYDIKYGQKIYDSNDCTELLYYKCISLQGEGKRLHTSKSCTNEAERKGAYYTLSIMKSVPFARNTLF